VFSPEELEAVLRVLQALAEDRARLTELDEETRNRLLTVAGQVSRPTRAQQKRLHKAHRKRDRAARRAHDAGVIAQSVNRSSRRSSTFVLPASTAASLPEPASEPASASDLKDPRACYVCKSDYRRVHSFYDSLCPPCAELNWQKRHQRADLSGRVALVTGARIKIGYQAALMLLRAGARVVATTRFPVDAAQRYAREPDFDSWRDRLTLEQIDLRDVPGVERLARHLGDTLPSLDLLINNAAQTVRRPPAFYRTLVEREDAALLPAHVRPLLAGATRPTTQLQLADDPDFPRGLVDLDDQQADLRHHNSWRLTAADVSTVELLEVHLVNAVAPFLLVARLKPLMLRREARDKHIVNVSAMEAQFARNKKTDKHPHTNMAKAALNMLTRTSAADYQRDGIFMNSVDTGWITDEDPLHHVARKQVVHDFHPPLDAIDGAARVLDPIFVGYASGDHPWGLFLKDYKPVAW
jgi:NAD(P)-dependent dehydrogenase (short-subunit alcohol dehydrogenase family)